MARVWIDADEWYPVYSSLPSDGAHIEIDVDDGRLAWWQRAKDDFDAAQEDMGNAARHSDERRGDRDAEGKRIVPRWPL